MLLAGLADDYEVAKPEGAFYAFPKLPWGTGLEFVTEAIEKYQLLVIPGNVFSRRDTHFRISYAADDRVIERGIEALRKLRGNSPQTLAKARLPLKCGRRRNRYDLCAIVGR